MVAKKMRTRLNHLSGHPVSGDSPRHPLTPGGSQPVHRPRKVPGSCWGPMQVLSRGASDWCWWAADPGLSLGCSPPTATGLHWGSIQPRCSPSSIFPDTLTFILDRNSFKDKAAASFGDPFADAMEWF